MKTTKYTMLTGWLTITLLVVIGTALVSCNTQSPPPLEPVVPEYNKVYTPSSIHIPTFDWYIVSEEDLQTIYKNSGYDLPSNNRVTGLTGMVKGKQVIITTAPKGVDDEVTLTLGHEVMHLAFGKYHQDHKIPR